MLHAPLVQAGTCTLLPLPLPLVPRLSKEERTSPGQKRNIISSFLGDQLNLPSAQSQGAKYSHGTSVFPQIIP